MFGKLLIKELKGTFLVPAVFISALLVVWDIFLRTRFGVWPKELILGLGLIPLFIPFLWTFVMSFYSLHVEWKTDSIYLLLSLPVKGWKVIGAKTVANLISLSGITIIGAGSFWLSFRNIVHISGSTMPTAETLVKIILSGGLMIMIMFFLMISISQFSFLLGRLAPKFRGLVTGIGFYFDFWLLGRIMQFLAPLLKRIPSVGIDLNVVVDGVTRTTTVQVNPGTPVTLILLGCAWFLASSLLFEKGIEI